MRSNTFTVAQHGFPSALFYVRTYIDSAHGVPTAALPRGGVCGGAEPLPSIQHIPEPPAPAPQTETTAQLPDELLSGSSAPPAYSVFFYNDVANFDIFFHISDVDSDYMDTSADIFL